MIKKDIEIDGKKISFRASATVPRLYRAFFRRDIFKDMMKLKDASDKNKSEDREFEIDDLEMFENVAFIMAKHADSSQPDTPDEWLEQFNMFSIYEILPQLIELWNLDNESTIESKKKFATVVEK